MSAQGLDTHSNQIDGIGFGLLITTQTGRTILSKALAASLCFTAVLVCLGCEVIFCQFFAGHLDPTLVYESSPTGWQAWGSHSLTRLIASAIFCGVTIYAVMARRMLKKLKGAAVVPDRIRQALDTLSEGLLVLDERQRIVLANRSFSKTVGISQEKLVGRRASSLPWVSGRLTGAKSFPWARAIDQSETQTEQLMRYRWADGTYRFFSINSSPIESPDSSQRGALATFRDVTEFEEHRAELEHMLAMLRNSRDEISTKNRELEVLARQDALTGCLNRRALFDGFATVWSDAIKDHSPIVCLMVDNDHFKKINDRYGHHVGDDVLFEVSSILQETFPSPSLVARYGGEEFCVVIPDATLAVAAESVEQARRKIEDIRLEGVPDLRATVSVGGSELCFGATEPQELINQADKCLYLAKANGRNQFVAFHDGLSDVSVPKAMPSDPTETDSAETTGLPFQAVTALVSALAFRDAETAEHSRRVADLCVRLSSGVLDQRDTYVLEIAALLHDIGKIGVPDNILLKPGPLSDEEWKLMRRHDRMGVEIATSTFGCEQLSEIIRTYRAFYGGRSEDTYLPVGEQIPIAARLLSLADSYDAMVSDRVYRKGRSHEDAIAELRQFAGSQFDPALVEHFEGTITDRYAASPCPEGRVPKQTAMQIGLQIERLADALDARDVDGLQVLASRLGAMARHHRIESIAVAAEKIEADAASDDMQWINLLKDTQRLLDLCRAAQDSFHWSGIVGNERGTAQG